MRVHFIAIGGSAMHNLAIALARKGAHVSGSDDEIFEPSRSRLQRENILPEKLGWFPDNLSSEIDAVILGMHARADNPELLRAKELGLKVYSYPEYLYEASKDKHRIVIGGSHGKTTITSMLLHVVKKLGLPVDYMVGAQLDGYDCMVKITDDAPHIILEGDEYLSSPIDRRPKFHLYQPDTALISGIAWDHINVFPTWENYVQQFEDFAAMIPVGGTLVFNAEDAEVNKIGHQQSGRITTQPYSTPEYHIMESGTLLKWEGTNYPLRIFGAHNLQNLIGAMYLGQALGISKHEFLVSMADFTGAGKRLQKVLEKNGFVMYKDFAHSPSKLKATTNAVKEKYPDRKVIACMELHTFSSLKKEFLPQYLGSMEAADEAVVYFSPEVVAHKKLEPISVDDVKRAFGGGVTVMNKTEEVLNFLSHQSWENAVLLMMSSGNFDGIDYDSLAAQLAQ